MPDINSFLGVKELRNYKILLKQVFAELLGTFLYLSIPSIVDPYISGSQREKHIIITSVGLSSGLIAGSVVQIIGNVSGGHINPAVTVGALVCGNIKALRALCYFVAQIVGGIAGAAVSYLLQDDERRYYFGITMRYSHEAIFALELLLTFVLVAVVLSVTDQNRGARGLGSSALAIGLSIAACEISCKFYTVGMNPVKILGRAVVCACVKSHYDWSRIWIYIVAPLVGGVLAGVVYKFVLNLKGSDRSQSITSE